MKVESKGNVMRAVLAGLVRIGADEAYSELEGYVRVSDFWRGYSGRKVRLCSGNWVIDDKVDIIWGER